MTMKFTSSHFPTVKVGTQGFNMSRMAYNDIPSMRKAAHICRSSCTNFHAL